MHSSPGDQHDQCLNISVYFLAYLENCFRIFQVAFGDPQSIWKPQDGACGNHTEAAYIASNLGSSSRYFISSIVARGATVDRTDVRKRLVTSEE